MKLNEQYIVEATNADGSPYEIISGDVSGAAKVSFVPQNPLLPRHDIAGLAFKYRFGRGFVHGMGGGMKEYIHCVVCESCRVYVRASTGTVLMTPPDYELYI